MYLKSLIGKTAFWIEKTPIMQWCLGVIAGAIIKDVTICAAAIVVWLCVSAVLSFRYVWIVFGLTTILVSFIFSSKMELPENHISHQNGTFVLMQAAVSEDIVLKEDKVSVVMEVMRYCEEKEEDSCNRWVARTGKVQVWLPRYPPARAGDLWEISGNLDEPDDSTEDFSYSSYLASKNVFSVMYRGSFIHTNERSPTTIKILFWRIGDILRGRIEKTLPEPHASLLSGMLFGFRSGQFEHFSVALQRTGVSHVIAASGYNVAVVTSFISKVTAKFHRRIGIILSVIGIWCFALIAGGSVPVVRAAVMSTYSCIGLLLGYSTPVHVALWLSMALFLCGDPSVIGDVSFQLSYASTAGLIYLSPLVEGFFPDSLRILKETAGVTLSAICATAPLSLVHFGMFSVVALAVNMIVLPLVAPAMGVGAMMLVVPPSLGVLSQGIAIVAWLPLDVFIKVVEFFSNMSFASLHFEKISCTSCILMYGVLLIAALGISSYRAKHAST